MRSLRKMLAAVAAVAVGVLSQAAISTPADAGACARASHHKATPKMAVAKPKMMMMRAAHKPAAKPMAMHAPKPKKMAMPKAAPKPKMMAHKPAPKKMKAAAKPAPKMAMKASARPGGCGTFKYFKAGKCVDKR